MRVGSLSILRTSMQQTVAWKGTHWGTYRSCKLALDKTWHSGWCSALIIASFFCTFLRAYIQNITATINTITHSNHTCNTKHFYLIDKSLATMPFSIGAPSLFATNFLLRVRELTLQSGMDTCCWAGTWLCAVSDGALFATVQINCHNLDPDDNNHLVRLTTSSAVWWMKI